jgi:hypothetical protein
MLVNQQQVFDILDKAKADFPYKIYNDNDGFGKDAKPFFSFYVENSKNPDKSFPVNDTKVAQDFAIWAEKWFGKAPKDSQASAKT